MKKRSKPLVIDGDSEVATHRQVEDALRENVEKYQAVVENSNDGIMIGQDGVMKFINSSFVAMLGYQVSEVQGSAFSLLIPAENLEILLERHKKRLAGIPAPSIYETTLLHKNGARIPVEVNASIVQYDGKPADLVMVRDITERKQSEALRENFYEMLNASLNEIYIFDAETLHFEFVSAGAIGNLGYTLDKLRQMTPLDLEPEFTPETFASLVAPLRLGSAPVIEFETVHRRADGSLYPVEIHLQLFKSAADHPVIMAVVLDVSERKRVEAVLRENQAQLQAIMDYSPALISIKDLSANVVVANRGFAVLDAPPLNELVGKNVFDIFPHEVAEQLWNNDLAALRAKKPLRSEEVVKHKDGTWHTYFTVKFPIYIKSDQPVGICAISNDITERKVFEEELRRREQEFLTLAENIPDLLVRFDTQLRHLYVNPAVERLAGIPKADYLGKTNEELGMAAEQVAFWNRELNLVITKAAARSFTFYFNGVDGIPRYFEAHVTPEFDASKQVVSLLSIVRDMTKQKQAEETLQEYSTILEDEVETRTHELRDANLQLENSLRLKDEFLAAISHELRTPLTGILGLAQVLQMGSFGEMPDKQLKLVRDIESSGLRLLEQVNQLIDMAELKARRLDIKAATFSLVEICTESLKQVEASARKKNLTANFTNSPENITLKIDETILNRMLHNLLSNAIKFTPTGGNFGIELSTDQAEQQVYIVVWDTGIGIKPEDQTRLFQPFVQLDGGLSRHFEGSGLGLAITRLMAELQGGSVEVRSNPGEGSRFTITLPWSG